MIPIIAAIQAWKFFKYLKFLPLLLCLAAGVALAWWIQGIRIEKFKIQDSKFKTEITACQEANQTNQKTLMSLKKEITDTNTLCSSRLSVKDKVIERLKYIDGLKPAKQIANKAGDSPALTTSLIPLLNKEGSTKCGVVEKEGNEKDNTADAHGDPILRELNGMFSKKNSKD